jgi:hypothetical protein
VSRTPHPVSRRAGASLLIGLSATIIGVLVLAGCGGSRAKPTAAVTRPSALHHDSIRAPKATELQSGMSVRVRRSVLHSVGWQVACSAHGRRVTAEAVRGQRTGAGEIAGYKGGSPSLSITHNRDGSITVSCR